MYLVLIKHGECELPTSVCALCDKSNTATVVETWVRAKATEAGAWACSGSDLYQDEQLPCGRKARLKCNLKIILKAKACNRYIVI